MYGGPKGPVNVYDPVRGHSCDSDVEAAAALLFRKKRRKKMKIN